MHRRELRQALHAVDERDDQGVFERACQKRHVLQLLRRMYLRPKRQIRIASMTIDELKQALEPVLAVVSKVDPADPEAADKLARTLPLDSPILNRVRELV